MDDLWNQREKVENFEAEIVWGMKDIAFREKKLLVWIEAMKNSNVVRLPKVGHYPQEEAPEVLVKAIRLKS